MLLNSHAEYRERIQLSNYLDEFFAKHQCIDESQANRFLELILNASNQNGIILGLGKEKDYQQSWQFGGETIFFTFTLLTTIGYGYLAPSTYYGKLFCVFYIIIGVPFTYLILYAISERIENLINRNKSPNVNRVSHLLDENDYSNYYRTRKCRNKIYLKCVCVGFGLILFVYVLPSILFSNIMEYPQWSFLDALYFCYISISTIGFGDFIPGRGYDELVRNNYRLAMTAYLFIGIIINMVFTNILMDLPFVKILSKAMIQKPRYYSEIIDPNENETTPEHQINSIRPINQADNEEENACEEQNDESAICFSSRILTSTPPTHKTKIV